MLSAGVIGLLTNSSNDSFTPTGACFNVFELMKLIRGSRERLMRAFLICITWSFAGSVIGEEPNSEHVKELFKSDNYTVTWGTPKIFDSSSVLEIGDGNGHGGTLGWIRFQPGKDDVDVLHIQYDNGTKPYSSKWPPDERPITIKSARMKSDTYLALLKDLAIVDAAELQRNGSKQSMSSNDFWVYARGTTNKKTLFDREWAGYDCSRDEVDYAQPRAMAILSRRANERLDLKEHSLTDEERTWASGKFVRDWEKFKDKDFHWWVSERYVVTIGFVGNSDALPALRDILDDDARKRVGSSSKDRCVYYAINAVTQLTKKDVRDKPVEEMDVEKSRAKILELLREKK